jgi:hypothetical protein
MKEGGFSFCYLVTNPTQDFYLHDLSFLGNDRRATAAEFLYTNSLG